MEPKRNIQRINTILTKYRNTNQGGGIFPIVTFSIIMLTDINTIVETINAILTARENMRLQTVEKIRQIENVKQKLGTCEQSVVKLQSILHADGGKSLVPIQETLQSLQGKIDGCIRSLNALSKRFRRKTLDIGVVGKARQGKSTLIQNLTGLGEDIILTGNEDHHTGAVVKFVHQPNVDPAHASADVEFYAKDKFLTQVLLPYYEEFAMSEQCPKTLDAFFAGKDISESDVPSHAVEHVSFINQLRRKLQQHVGLFGETEDGISAERINEFTAKCKPTNKKEKQSLWAMVESAKVGCSFPFLPREQRVNISISDTPGFGDRKVLKTADEKIKENLSDNIDAVLWVTAIFDDNDSGGISREEIDFYNKLDAAIGEIELNKWLYYIVNHKQHTAQNLIDQHYGQVNNEAICPTFKGVMPYKVNCSDVSEVERMFLSVLNLIKERLPKLDKTLYRERVDNANALLREIGSSLNDVLKQVQDEKQGVRAIVPKIEQPNPGDAIQERAEAHLVDVTKALDHIVERYRNDKDNSNSKFIKNLSKLEDELLPSKSDSQDTGGLEGQLLKYDGELDRQKLIDAKTGIDLYHGYGYLCQEIRRHIIGKFDGLDDGLRALFDELRQKAVIAFIAPTLICENGEISVTPESAQTIENVGTQMRLQWDDWKSLENEISGLGTEKDYQKTAGKIAGAINNFSEALLTFRNFLLPRILPCFDALNPSCSRGKHAPYSYPHNTKKSGDELIEELLTRIDLAAKNGISKALNKCKAFAEEPAMALLAAIEELHDAVTKTGGADKAKRIWVYFYSKYPDALPPSKNNREAERKKSRHFHTGVDQLETELTAAQASALMAVHA